MKKLLGGFLYAGGVSLMGWDVYAEFRGGTAVNMSLRMALAGLLFIMFFSSYRILAGEFPKYRNRILRVTLWFLFLYYLCILFTLLFLNYSMGRNLIRQGLNLHPLFTIRNYYLTYRNGHMPRGIFFINMIGNVAAFAPMGFFGPVLFRRMAKFWGFIWRMGLAVMMVEIIQRITYTGSCDIDDWILNMCGAVMVYLSMQLPYFNRFRLWRTDQYDQKNCSVRRRADWRLHGQNH